MTYAEHCKFMAEVQTQFPALKSWLKDQLEENRKQIWNAWVKVFRDISAETLDAAVQRMLSEKDAQVFGDRWDQFPAKLIALFKPVARKPPRGGPRCEFCWGDGIVEVGIVSPSNTIDGNPLRAFNQNGETLYGPIGACCPCTVGKHRNELRDLKLPEYDRGKMRRFKQSAGDHCDQLDRVREDERKTMRQATLVFEDGQTYEGLDLPSFGEAAATVANALTTPM
jgi:hypothetical protein